MITVPPIPAIPADVAADCAPDAPVPAHVAAHAERTRQARQRHALHPVPAVTPTAAGMLAAHLQSGDVIRHPDVTGGFLRITHREPDGTLFGYAIHHVTGALDGRITPVRLPDTRVIAVWAV